MDSKRFLVAITLFLTLFLVFRFSEVQGEPQGYTYYGFMPSDMPGPGGLLVTGNNDNTFCQLYNISIRGEEQLIEKFTVNKMELKAISVQNATFFKLVSDKFVTTIIIGQANVSAFRGDSSISYPSVSGTYVGKEFVIPITSTAGQWNPYRIYSLDDASIKISEADGTLFKETNLPANGFYFFIPDYGKVYHIESTGYIMVASYTFGESYFVPVATGGYVGKVFYGSGDRTQKGRSEADYERHTFVSSIKGAKVKLFDLTLQKWVREIEVPPESSVDIMTKDLNPATLETGAYVISADNPISVLYQSNGTGMVDYTLNPPNSTGVEGGVSIAGFKANEATIIFVPKYETYLFASEACTVTIDDLNYNLIKDEFLPILPGTHKLVSTSSIILQIVNYDPRTRYGANSLSGFAESLPAVETLGLSPADLVLKPPEEQSNTMNYIIAGAAVAVVAAVAIVLLRRRSGKKSGS